MIVTAWNIGTHNRNGSGYGFRVKNADRDTYFQKEWKSIFLEIEESESVEVVINPEKFWSINGYELVSTAIGKWLRKNGLAPWPHSNPPTFEVEQLKDNHFKIVKLPKNKKPF
jgi:hypothetical protein